MSGLVPSGQPGGVAEHVARGDGLFASGGELGPVGGDRFVEIEVAPVGEHETAQCRHRLGGRPHVDDRVLLPVTLDARHAGVVVVGTVECRRAAPQIDDRHTCDGDGNRCPDVALGGEVVLERSAYRLEARFHGAMDGGLVARHLGNVA